MMIELNTVFSVVVGYVLATITQWLAHRWQRDSEREIQLRDALVELIAASGEFIRCAHGLARDERRSRQFCPLQPDEKARFQASFCRFEETRVRAELIDDSFARYRAANEVNKFVQEVVRQIDLDGRTGRRVLEQQHVLNAYSALQRLKDSASKQFAYRRHLQMERGIRNWLRTREKMNSQLLRQSSEEVDSQLRLYARP